MRESRKLQVTKAQAAGFFLALVCLSAALTAEASLVRRRRQEDATTTPATSEPSTTTATTESGSPKESTKSKIPAVNWTEVNANFESFGEESEVVAHWRNMDKQLTDGVRAVLKLVFPQIVAMASDAKVSGQCSGAILKWILNLRNLRTWAVKMLDATGKPSAGLLEGSLTLFGHYKQCLAVRAPDEDEIELENEFREYFRGQYCVLQLKPHLPRTGAFLTLNSTIDSLKRPQGFKYYEKSIYDELAELAANFNFVSIRADLCVPSLCSRDDIQRVATFLAKKADMRARVLRCDVQPQEGQLAAFADQAHLLWAAAALALVLAVLGASLAQLALKHGGRHSKGRAQQLVGALSLSKSLSHIKNVHIERLNDSKPAFLYALRLLIVVWLALVALISQLEFQFLRDLLPLRELIVQWPMQLLVNSSLAFDALILLTAFTYAYTNVNSNLKDLVKYNASKYSRLMPSVMLFVALQVLLPLFYANQSPIWRDFVDKPAQVCKSTGLLNLAFLQNFLNYDQMCLPQSWLFCVELQLCVLAIPLLLMMNKEFDQNHGKFHLSSWATLGLLTLAPLGCLLNFRSIYQNQLPAAWFHTFPNKDDRNLYYSLHLTKPWSHLTVFAVGLFAGHLCRCQSIETFSGGPYGRKSVTALMWLTSLCLMCVLIFPTHGWSLSATAHLEWPIASALYGALAPLAWSLAWSLILFHLTVPNEKNQRPTLSTLLNNDINLIRLGRLTFLAYLINPYVNTFVLAAQESAVFSSVIMLAHTFIGNLALTFSLAFAVSALVELPCRRLIKKLVLGSRRQCGNLGIITRQLDIRQQNLGPSHDSFSASAQPTTQQPAQKMHLQPQPQPHQRHHVRSASGQQLVMGAQVAPQSRPVA